MGTRIISSSQVSKIPCCCPNSVSANFKYFRLKYQSMYVPCCINYIPYIQTHIKPKSRDEIYFKGGCTVMPQASLSISRMFRVETCQIWTPPPHEFKFKLVKFKGFCHNLKLWGLVFRNMLGSDSRSC